MTQASRPRRILVVTGLSGAGRTTALKSLEDLGWEVVDNVPLRLIERLLESPPPAGAIDEDRPFALGIDSRTRGFDTGRILSRVSDLRRERGLDVAILFLDCSSAELVRRYSETRRRHPLAVDRPAQDGVLRERELLGPLRAAADHLIDTTGLTTNGLQAEIRAEFGEVAGSGPTLSIMSFGFSRGVPRQADLMFDMRFLRNPHWVPELKPLSGLDAPVADYVAADPAYADAIERIEGLLLALLPRYAGEGKSYVTVAIGCTGGRHRSVHVAERLSQTLRAAGFSPTLTHRDLVR